MGHQADRARRSDRSN